MKEKLKAFWQRLRKPPEYSSGLSWVLTLGLMVLAAVGITCLCLIIGSITFERRRFFAYLDDADVLLFNFAPVLLVMLLLYALTNRAWISYLLTGITFLGLSFVNYFKIALRGDPFTFSDFSVAKEGVGIAGSYELILPNWFYISVFLLVAGSLVLLRYGRARVKGKRWWIRVLSFCAVTAAGFGLWQGVYRDTDRYDEMLYVNQEVFNVWKDAENYASKGFIYSFLDSVAESFPELPEGYSAQRAQELLGAYEDKPIPQEQQVNVVVTMLESFADLSVYDSIHFTSDPYESYHALLEECYHGTLISDTIGGGTNNAERSFLTGFTFPQPNYRGQTNSFVHYFGANGYYTDGSHPGYEWFYERADVNRRLGFDRYLLTENYWWQASQVDHADDAFFFPELRRIYEEQTQGDAPYFSYSISYQNHSPYNTTALDGAEYISHEGLNDEAYYLINNYLHGIKDTGDQVSAYVDQFREDEEPVVLLFFGDHKASFGNANCYYPLLGLNDSVYTPDGCRDMFSVPYFIWANDAAKAVLGQDFRGEGHTISPAFLMTELFDACGWEGSSWIQYQRSVREHIPVMHRDFLYIEDGEMVYDLSEEGQQLYTDFLIVQHYLRKEFYSYDFAANSNQ